ncbi:MAG: heme exporter protein CcmB [Gammaproteobacteria bacterium]|nr:heme exporter protein CcmB [Gammaproteobacteria bacterium]
MVALFVAQLRREIQTTARAMGEAIDPLIFLFLAITLFALSVGGGVADLHARASGIIWVLVLLANMLSLESLFRRDYDDGTLEQMLLLAQPAFVPILAKITAQWCLSGLAMTLLAPLAALILFLPASEIPVLLLSLLVGTPALSLFGAVGAALTVGLRRGGVLLGLLILPLYVPVLIFGAGAVSEHMAGVSMSAQIYWLLAITMLALTVAPFAVQAALRISIEQ